MDKSCATDNSLAIGLSIAGAILFLVLIAFVIWIVLNRLKQIERTSKIEDNPENMGFTSLQHLYSTASVAHDKKKEAFDRKMAQFDELKDLPRFEKYQIQVGKILGK